MVHLSKIVVFNGNSTCIIIYSSENLPFIQKYVYQLQFNDITHNHRFELKSRLNQFGKAQVCPNWLVDGDWARLQRVLRPKNLST